MIFSKGDAYVQDEMRSWETFDLFEGTAREAMKWM